MSEELPALMYIGGSIPCSVVPGLMDAIREQGISWGYGDYSNDRVEAHDADSLLAELRELGFEKIEVGDCSSNYGRFSIVEAYCQKCSIAYDILADPKDNQHGGFYARWRPGMGEAPVMTSFDGDSESIPTYKLEKVLKKLEQGHTVEVLEMLRKLIHPAQELGPLTIAEDT